MDGAPEATIMQNLLVRWHGIDDRHVTVEPTSTNCGANAEEAYRLLQAQGRAPKDIMLMQDPTMQRRTWASFRRVWMGTMPSGSSMHRRSCPSCRCGTGGLLLRRPRDQAAGRWSDSSAW